MVRNCVENFELKILNEFKLNEYIILKTLDDGWMDGWVGGWMDGWVDGWMDGKARLRIAYSNQKAGLKIAYSNQLNDLCNRICKIVVNNLLQNLI